MWRVAAGATHTRETNCPYVLRTQAGFDSNAFGFAHVIIQGQGRRLRGFLGRGPGVEPIFVVRILGSFRGTEVHDPGGVGQVPVPGTVLGDVAFDDVVGDGATRIGAGVVAHAVFSRRRIRQAHVSRDGLACTTSREAR